MNKIEALADSILEYSGYRDPSSAAYKARNPGALKAVSPRHVRNDQGLRVFSKMIDGYSALVFDLIIKCSGKSRSGLRERSTLADLSRSLGFIEGTERYLAKWCRKALNDDTITEDTPLSYFLLPEE